MDRQDDPSISGDLLLLRRIPPRGDRVSWAEDGTPIPSSFNFKDKDDELSVYIRVETTAEAVLHGHPGFGLVCFTAQQAREACGPGIILCRCAEEPDQGHVLICGKISGGAAKRLQKAAIWFEDHWPSRISPDIQPGASGEAGPRDPE